MRSYALLVLHLVFVKNSTFGNIVEPSCPKTDSTCHFYLSIQEHFTMIISGAKAGIRDDVFIPFKFNQNGTLTTLDTCISIAEKNESVIEEGKLSCFFSLIFIRAMHKVHTQRRGWRGVDESEPMRTLMSK